MYLEAISWSFPGLPLLFSKSVVPVGISGQLGTSAHELAENQLIFFGILQSIENGFSFISNSKAHDNVLYFITLTAISTRCKTVANTVFIKVTIIIRTATVRSGTLVIQNLILFAMDAKINFTLGRKLKWKINRIIRILPCSISGTGVETIQVLWRN